MDEDKSIGFLKWNGKVVGCAKIKTITNPIDEHLYIDDLITATVIYMAAIYQLSKSNL